MGGKRKACVLYYKWLHHEESQPDPMEKTVNLPETLESHMDGGAGKDLACLPWEGTSYALYRKKGLYRYVVAQGSTRDKDY